MHSLLLFFLQHKSNKTKKLIKTMFCSIIVQILILFRYYLDKVINCIFEYYWSGKEETCSPVHEDFYIMDSAVSIAKKIREKQLTSEEVVMAYLRRINKVSKFLFKRIL